MRLQPFRHGFYRDLGRPLLREAEYARRDTTEGDRAEPVFRAHVKRVFIAFRKLPFVLCGESAGDYRPNDMDDLCRLYEKRLKILKRPLFGGRFIS